MTEKTQPSSVRRGRVRLVAAVVVAATGPALGGNASAAPPSSSPSGDGPYGGGSGGGASRTGYFSQASVVSLDLETLDLAVPAGEFTAPVTGTCLITGAADFRWDGNNGHDRLGYTYGGLVGDVTFVTDLAYSCP